MKVFLKVSNVDRTKNNRNLPFIKLRVELKHEEPTDIY